MVNININNPPDFSLLKYFYFIIYQKPLFSSSVIVYTLSCIYKVTHKIYGFSQANNRSQLK